MTTFGFIGTGHLGSILAEKFIQTGAMRREEIWISNHSPNKAFKLAEKLKVQTADNLAVAENSDVLFLCVRPLHIKGVIAELHELLTADKLIVSVAADFTLGEMKDLCRARIARAIPSIASDKGLGVTLIVLEEDAREMDRSLLFSLFGSIGWPVEAAEEQLEVLSDLTSSGPGYIAAILREFVQEATMRGVDRCLAEELIRKTLSGTAALMEDKSFDDLIAMVATRGGITEEGVRVIKDQSPELFRQLFAATSARHQLVKEKINDRKE